MRGRGADFRLSAHFPAFTKFRLTGVGMGGNLQLSVEDWGLKIVAKAKAGVGWADIQLFSSKCCAKSLAKPVSCSP